MKWLPSTWIDVLIHFLTKCVTHPKIDGPFDLHVLQHLNFDEVICLLCLLRIRTPFVLCDFTCV